MAAQKQVKPTPRRHIFTPTSLTTSSAVSCSSTYSLPSVPSIVEAWQPIVSCAAPFTLSDFFLACTEMTLHPEYLSSTILRADLLVDQGEPRSTEHEILQLEGYECTRRIRRKLLPKRSFDWAMEQECLYYRRRRRAETEEDERDAEQDEGAVILFPDMTLLRKDHGGKIPFYHPQVVALAFRYVPTSLSVETSTEDPTLASPLVTVQIDIIPLPTTTPSSEATQIDDRLYRSSLALLKFLHSFGRGIEEGFVKNVHHDLLAGKEEVQDLYRQLKNKYQADLEAGPHDPRITFRWMMKEWKEETDPRKHLFEDVAIAAWLMVVWRDMYPESDGKPPGGFVDIGCGNGLLVYLLSCEGYPGYGLDLRARKSWSAYNPQPRLKTTSLDPPTLLSSPLPPFPPNSFLIGNHADELTPWIPLFAASTPGAKFLSIPCCHHTLSSRFTCLTYTIPPHVLALSNTDDDDDEEEMMRPFLAPAPNLQTGRAHAYQLYLAHLTILCGFVPEREALRIPSTKNFGFLGRRRVKALSEEEVKANVRRFVDEHRGGWKARVPEGKAGQAHCRD